MTARTLSDSDARWEAVSAIDDVVRKAVNDGVISNRGDERGWTDADVAAVERHMRERAHGLVVRPRRST